MGIDDLMFGAQMIAAAHYLIPARDCVSLHPVHEGRKVSRHEERTVELLSNYEAYVAYVGDASERNPHAGGERAVAAPA